MDRRILPIPGLPHYDRNLLHCISHQWHRYESTITPVCNDHDRQAGPTRARKDFRPTTKILTSLRQEQGRHNFFVPMNERVRQRPFDDALRAELEWMSQQMGKLPGRNLLPLHHPHNNGGNTNIKTLIGANTKTPNGEIISGGKSDGYRLFANPMWQPLCKIHAHS